MSSDIVSKAVRNARRKSAGTLRRITKGGSPDALKLNGKAAPEAGWEIVPKREANALVAYLLSLRADTPLFNAPIKLTMASASAATNAPATNAPAPPK